MSGFDMLSFTRPVALLLLLLLVPLTVFLSRTSMALLRPAARRASLALRLLIVALLVLALSGVGIVQASDTIAAVFLLDRSDSVPREQQAAHSEYVRSAIEGMSEGEQAGVVVFGASALVDRPASPDTSVPDLQSKPATTFSNLAEAIRLGLAVMPAASAGRLVLLSDGSENVGSAEWATRLAGAHGVPVDVVPATTSPGPDVWIEALSAPTAAREGEQVALEVSVSSSTDTTATLTLLMDGVQINRQPVRLTSGPNTFVQNLPPAVRGFHTYSAQIEAPAEADARRENDRYSAFTLVSGKPRLLMVEGHAGEAAALVAGLAGTMDADVVAPGAVPADARGLAGYDGVVLVNVPASQLDPAAMDSLQLAVRDLGKGLVVVGGDESYAAGGYFRTPIEEMLPVDLHLPSKLDIPTVAMVLVIDRSGSMEMAHSGSGGVTKIELAKEAASRAVAQLSERDYAGVITFDSAANWVVELQPLGDPALFKSRIGSVTSGGGTDIYAGLRPAVDALVQSKAKSKHIVLLTDGVSAPGDYEGLIAKMGENSITLSGVAVGADADTALMQWLAAQGKGRYYYTEDGNALPAIFAHESHIAARSYLIEHEFTPERVFPSAILDGLGGLPVLLGYVGTSPRPGGQIVLVSDAGDPVLAQWQYGLGRVVAWTSDATGRWGKQWVGWSDFARFWQQTARWSTSAEAGGALQARVVLEAGTAHVSVDASAPDGSFLNGLEASATLIDPSGVTATVQLRQSAAGRYEGEFDAAEEGAYLLRAQALSEDGPALSTTTGLVVPYSPEYVPTAGGAALLERLAALTGGSVISTGDLRAPFAPGPRPVRSTTELWPLLLLLSILLFPLDIGLRRVSVTRRDMALALGELRRRFGVGVRRQPAGMPATATQMQSLFSAKERVRERSRAASTPHRVAPSLVIPEPPTLGGEGTQAQELPTLKTEGAEVLRPAAPAQPLPARLVGEQDEETLAARLRRARERR
jgi:Mg-chelatase subunit ChlD